MKKAKTLYHGSPVKIEGALQPILINRDDTHQHDQPIVFATDEIRTALLFMFPTNQLHILGTEGDIYFVCVWGKEADVKHQDPGGYLYELPNNTFTRMGKPHEWQSLVPVHPTRVIHFDSIINAFTEHGILVYAIHDNELFDELAKQEGHRLQLLTNMKPINKT